MACCSDCGCAYEICNDLLSRFRGFCGSNPCIPLGSWMTILYMIPAYLAYYMGQPSLWSFLLHTSFGWEGGSSSLLDGSGWRRGAVAQGVAHFMLWSMMALGPAFDNSWIRGRSRVVRGSFGGSFGGHLFHLCSLSVLWLSHRLSLLLFSCFPLFPPSYSFSNQAILAEWLFVMQSSAGRRAVCSGSGGLSHDCYAATLYPSRPSPCVLMDCCDPPVTRSWRLFRKRFIHIQENCSDFSPRLYSEFSH